MSVFEDIIAKLEKLPDEHKDVATGIKDLAQLLNQDRGKALTDLEAVKGKNKELQGFQSSYSELMAALSAAGVETKNAKEVAEKLKVKKTDDEASAELQRVLKETDKQLKEALAKNARFEMASTLKPSLEKAIKEWKDKDGNPKTIADKFIEQFKDELYKPLDLTSEVMVNERITTVLKGAEQAQDTLLSELGQAGIIGKEHTVHKVDTGGGHFAGNQNPDSAAVFEKVRTSGGSIDSVAEGIALVRAQQKQE